MPSPFVRGRQVVVALTNSSGGGVVAGDVVIVNTGADTSFTTTTTGQAEVSIGIAQETIANSAVGRVLIAGFAALVNVPASVTRGHYVETHTVAKQATGSATRRAGSFGQFLTGGTSPTAVLWGSSDQTASGTGETYTGWTPELTATTTNPTLGSGSTAEGRYFQNGKHVRAYGAIKFGTSGVNAGSGTYRFSMPVSMRTPSNFDGYLVGHGYLFDDNTGAVRYVYASYVSGTTAQLTVVDGSSVVTNASPWTWAASDLLIMAFDYEAA